eukprot:COSAG01_NODE_45655_length_407_cov_1.360390_1_plen_132_part_10
MSCLGSGCAGGDAVCRICLESLDDPNPFADNHLIAPCRCKGTQAWVHRGCLNRWRSVQQDRAFSQCTECFFTYEYIVLQDEREDKGWLFDDGPLTAKRRRRLKFQLYVARDFMLAFFAMQMCVFLLGSLIKI